MPSNATPTVLCIGGSNIDRKLRLLGSLQLGTSNPARSPPETPGGVARNVAENLARLGFSTRLVTAVGDDAAGQALLAQAAQLGLSTQGSLIASAAASDSYSAVLDQAGEMLLALSAMPLVDRLTPAQLVTATLDQATLTVIDLNLPADSVATLIEAARAHNSALLIVAVSAPKLARLPQDLRGLQCLILNQSELRAAAPAQNTDAALLGLHARGVRQILVTSGPDGVICSELGRAPQHLLPPAVAQIADVTGAGDAFAAGVCAGLLHPPPDLMQAARLGLQLAALTLQTEATVHPGINPAWLAAHLETPRS